MATENPTSFTQGTLWRLAGPAAETWHALVLMDTRPEERASVPEVLVAPVRAHDGSHAVTAEDVTCPPRMSPTGEQLIVAVWAAAPIPVHCLAERLGELPGVLMGRIHDVIARLRARGGTRHPLHPRPGEPEWHRELRNSLSGYWDGSVIISCASLPAAEQRKAS